MKSIDGSRQTGYSSFDGGVYGDGGGGDHHNGDHHNHATQLERGRSSLRRGGPPAGGYRGSSAGGGHGQGQGHGQGHGQGQGQGQGHGQGHGQRQASVDHHQNASFNFQQAMNDHFDHYKRTPSRDRSRDPSMDRFRYHHDR